MTTGRRPSTPASARGTEAQQGDAVVAVVEHRRAPAMPMATASGSTSTSVVDDTHAFGELDDREELRHLVGERRRGRLHAPP